MTGRGLVLGSLLAAVAAPAVAFADSDRLELGWYPAVQRLNGDLTNQLGMGGVLTWHVTDGFALQGRFTHRVWSWLTADNWEESAPAASQRWSALAGTEIRPVGWTGALMSAPARLDLVVSGAVGAAAIDYGSVSFSSRPVRNWLDTGPRLAASVGLGVRLRVGQRISLRLEVTDVIASSKVDSVRGCSRADMEELYTRLSSVEPGCRRDRYRRRATWSSSTTTRWTCPLG